MKNLARTMLAAAAIALTPSAVLAQGAQLQLPDVSPHATVSQAVGLTEIAIDYHRPAINDRQIWGALVPWDTVWRAGANENTTISFSTPVRVQGKDVEAGTYGLHMIPRSSGDWTLILSNQSRAWGSFAYDESKDALRVNVSPEPGRNRDRLLYVFDDPTASSVTAALEWETLRVPFRIDVDVQNTVLADIREQLTGQQQFFWQPWNQAANWMLNNEGDLAEAEVWVDRSIGINRTFQNLQTKASILERRGNVQQARTLRGQAMDISTEQDLNFYGYQLLGQERIDDAIAIFQRNVDKHPESWNVYDSLAEAYARKGEIRLAIEGYEKARRMTTNPQQRSRIDQVLRGLRSDS